MDSATLTALAQPGLVLRHFVYIIALSGDEFGFWEGIDDVTVSVPAARTGVSTSRDYRGGMAFDAVPNAVYSGDIKQQYSITFDLTHVTAETMVRGYDLRLAAIEIHRGTFDAGGGGLVSDPVVLEHGQIIKAESELSGPGQAASFTLDFKTIDAANRGQPDRKSNASQIDRSAGDLFYKYASRGREIAREWGSYSRK